LAAISSRSSSTVMLESSSADKASAELCGEITALSGVVDYGVFNGGAAAVCAWCRVGDRVCLAMTCRLDSQLCELHERCSSRFVRRSRQLIRRYADKFRVCDIAFAKRDSGYPPPPFFARRQRACTAFRAASRRCSAERFFARARPPSLPRVRASSLIAFFLAVISRVYVAAGISVNICLLTRYVSLRIL